MATYYEATATYNRYGNCKGATIYPREGEMPTTPIRYPHVVNEVFAAYFATESEAKAWCSIVPNKFDGEFFKGFKVQPHR